MKTGRRESRTKYLERHYGITVSNYNDMLDAQGGGCGICGIEPDRGRVLSVDHCHNTNVIRGLLCGNCNRGIGFFKDDAETLERAANYVREHPAREFGFEIPMWSPVVGPYVPYLEKLKARRDWEKTQ